jgi:hypothetical protein
MKRGPGSLTESLIYVSEAMTDRLDELALEVARVLDCEVTRAAVIRAAVVAWLDVAQPRPDLRVSSAIRAATKRNGECPRLRHRQRWTKKTAQRLADLARVLRPSFDGRLTLAAMVRAALVFWMSAVEQLLPVDVAEEVRPHLEKRGRKKRTP